MLFTKKRIVLCAIAASVTGMPAMAQKAANHVVAVQQNERDHTPSAITFSGAAGYKAADAGAVFNEYLGLNPATDEMRYRTADQASAEVSVARYEQYYKGIKVEHGNYIIASKNGLMSYMSGNFYKVTTPLSTVARLTAAGALAKALDYTAAKEYMWQLPGADQLIKEETGDPAATYTPKGQLVYIEDYMAGDEPDGRLHLAWKFDIYATQPMSRNEIYVDAENGRILFVNALMKHIAGTGTSVYSGQVPINVKTNASNYSLHDTVRGSGINTYSLNGSTTVNAANRVEVTSATTSFAQNVAVDAHWGAEMVYDYWQTKRSRLSWNGTNGALNSYVNYGNAYNNAMWNGSAMVYGNGSGRSGGGFDPLVSLDITGHEIGHGVCQSTAALVYNRESGAMNEGFSDIWGAAIESYADPHEVDATPKSTWEIGEEISNTPLRSMANPKLYGNPDTYGGQYWTPASSSCTPSSTNDNCGVHNNSGVLNKWFYLLSAGGSGINDLGSAYAVPGVSIDTAAMIAYGTELSLTSTANYAACRTASINYASTQFGACSRYVEAVTRAWYAVGVGSNFTPCSAQISFNGASTNVNEGVGSNDCTASHVVNIPIAINGPAPTGGNATATVTVTGGTAVSGVNYLLGANTVTFPAGSTAPQFIPVTIYDNGNVRDNGLYFDLAISVSANGSTAAAANVLTQTRVNIVENDAAPAIGGINTQTTTGSSSATGNVTSPFLSSSNQGHVQYLFTASELAARNIQPNAPLTKIGFFVTSKNSTRAFSNYTVSLGNTTATNFTNTFITGLTQVFSDSVVTTSNLNTLTFSNGFSWDGSSNLVVDICFTNANHDAANDAVLAYSGATARAAYVSDNGTGGGCALPFNSSNISDVRPRVTFTQEIPSAKIAAALGDVRRWNIQAGKETYFYTDADTAAIAGVVNDSTEMGCIEAKLTGAGNGFSHAVFADVNRSLKEVQLSGASNDTIGYNAIIYFKDAELNGLTPSSLYLVKTTAATDAAMVPSNTQIVASPTVIAGLNFKGFKAHFNGMGRFFLADRMPTLGVGNLATENGMSVINNPFRQDIQLGTNLQKAERAGIRLYDVTGKLVYSEQRSLPAGRNTIAIRTGDHMLVPGNYVLQVICSDRIYTQKLIKE